MARIAIIYYVTNDIAILFTRIFYYRMAFDRIPTNSALQIH